MYHYIIVDDEPLIRMGTLKKLEALSDKICCVGEADNGEQAIELLEKNHIDLVILDMEMPVMDGTQLLPYLAEHYHSLQLIVISGYKSFDYVKYAISANVVDYILKPFSDVQIQQTVLQALEKLEASESISAQIKLSEEQKEMAYYEYDTQLIQNLILGYSVSDTSISSDRLSFLRQCSRLYLAMVYSSKSLLELHLQEHLTELGFSQMSLYLPHPSNPKLGFFVLCPPGEVSYTPQVFYTKFVQDFMTHLSIYGAVSWWGISQPHVSLEQLHSAYRECCTVLNTLPVDQAQSWYSVSPVSKPAVLPSQEDGLRAPSRYPEGESALCKEVWSKKEEFLFRVEAGMTAEVQRLLLELREYYKKFPGLTLADLKYHYHQLAEDCALVLKQYLNQSGTSQSMQNIVREIFSPDELHLYYSRFFSNLSEMLKPQSVYAIDDTIEQIKIYTRRNMCSISIRSELKKPKNFWPQLTRNCIRLPKP